MRSENKYIRNIISAHSIIVFSEPYDTASAPGRGVEEAGVVDRRGEKECMCVRVIP